MTAHPDPAALLRSKSYAGLLVICALLGVPISAAAYGFLALVSYLQSELFTHLPHGLGFTAAPQWWPAPVLFVGAMLVVVAIKTLPGNGGPSPAGGFKLHKPPTAAQLPGVVAAALATLCFGMVLGPEMPLIMLGGGLAALAVRLAKKDAPEQATSLVASAGSFAAISTLLGSPILGAFLLMEASGLGGAMLGLALVPGLLASGIGSLIFIGLDSLTGLGTFSLAITGLPGFSRPNIAEFGWAVVIGLAAAVIGAGLHWMAPRVHRYAEGRTLLVLPAGGLAVAGLAIAFSEATGKSTAQVLFSGQSSLGPLVHHAASYSAAALVLLLACKGLAYGTSLGCFRGGPIFPAMFMGAAGGIAMSHLPGLPMVAGVAMGIGAMSAVMLSLPLTSVLLATLLLGHDGLAVMPLAIVAVVVAHVASAWITAPPEPAEQAKAVPAEPAGARPAGAGHE
ncbi:MAG: chloride channel protein [Streptosporangiaceae bacterium]